MYLYFDKKGVLLEIVNDEALRQYNHQVNTMYVYIENVPTTELPQGLLKLQYWFERPNGETTEVYDTLSHPGDVVVTETVPFDIKRDVRKFRYGTRYKMFKIEMPSGRIIGQDESGNPVYEYNIFEDDGPVSLTIKAIFVEGAKELTLGKVVFTIEKEVVIPTDSVSVSQYEYILRAIDALTFTVGKVTTETLDPTSEASVTVTQDKSSTELKNYPVDFEFGIPRGATFTPAVAENGDISWTNDGGLDNPQTVNIKGPIGITPDISIDATVDDTTGTPTVEVIKSGVGTVPTYTFNFKHLKGTDGQQGEAGLMYLGIWTNEITIPTYYNSLISDFSRTPKIGETFIMFSNKSQYALMQVVDVRDGRVESVVYNHAKMYVVSTKGQDGAQGTGVKSITSGTPTIVGDKTNTPITITLTDGTTVDLVVSAENGKDGTSATVTIVQATGQSTTAVMSQKAVTDELAKKATTSEVNAKYTKPESGIPKSDLATGVQTSLDKADSALQSAPVTSVNGKTGAVQLGASDVGALPTSTKYVVSVNGESGEVKNIAKTNSANTFTGDQTVTGNGSVSGNFTVGGNLTVNGTTTTVDSTTLQVKDKLIEVAHGNTTTLTTPAGLVAPKYDGTNSGALVFDSTGTAYVGDVKLDSTGNIDVSKSELQPLATRTGLVGGNLVQYDSSALTLKDSGKKISDLALTSQLPTVNNGTLTIQKNGTNVATFGANQSTNATANITVPVKVSELTNDSGFTTNKGTITGINMNGASKGTSGIVDLGTVITAHQDISGKANLSGGNTFSGNQVITGYLDIRGTAAEKHLKTRGIGGSDGNGNSSDLYLQYSSNYKTYFGNTAQSSLNADGSISINGKTAATTDQIPDISGKQDKLTAGSNITISGNTISAVVPTDVVKYTAQTLTDAQKSQARSNIGAGTSNFSGNYNDLSNKPTPAIKSATLTGTTLYLTL